MILSNSFDQLYVDSESKTVSAQTITSEIQYYIGNELQTDFDIEIDNSNLPEGVSAQSEDYSIVIQIEPGVTISSDFVVGITVGSIKKEFVVKVIKGNVDYDLWVSKNVFKTGDEIEFCVYKTDLLTNEKQKFKILESGPIKIEMDFIPNEDGAEIVTDDGYNYRIKAIYLDKSITLTLKDAYGETIDRQTIVWIKDGKDGEKGAGGENATTYSLVLSSNTFKVPGESITIHVTKIDGNNPPEVVEFESLQEYLKIVIKDSNEQLYDSSSNDGDVGGWSETERCYYTYNIQTSSTVEL